MGIPIVVVYSSGPRGIRELAMVVEEGCTVGMALKASGILAALPEALIQSADVGVWGRKISLDQQLRPQDRIEVYRPLQVDPKVARRERFARQGAKGAGLFAKRRTGAKAGY